MPARMIVIITTTNPQILTSISSGLNLLFNLNGFSWLNFLLQYWCDKVFRTGLCEQTARLLALFEIKVVWVLAGVAVAVFTPSKQCNQNKEKLTFHVVFFLHSSTCVLLQAVYANAPSARLELCFLFVRQGCRNRYCQSMEASIKTLEPCTLRQLETPSYFSIHH